MLESVTPDPTQDELTAILAALSRRPPGNDTRAAAWSMATRDPDSEYDDLRAAARGRTRRLP